SQREADAPRERRPAAASIRGREPIPTSNTSRRSPPQQPPAGPRRGLFARSSADLNGHAVSAGRASRAAGPPPLPVLPLRRQCPRSPGGPTMPRFAILEHDHPHRHWDLLLEAGPVLRSWRLSAPPGAADDLAAEPTPDHRPLYLDYEGPVG